MKKSMYITIFISALLAFACSDENLGSSKYYKDNPFEGYIDYSKEKTLQDTRGWESDTLGTGYIWYQYEGFYQNQNANQNVNVLEIDLNNPEYQVEFVYLDAADSLSSVALSRDAVAGINGTYELDASFVKTNGTTNSQVTINKDHLRYWKHEGAISFDGKSTASIGFGTNEEYLNSPALNILSGSPMLIDEFKQVGENFIGDISGIDLSSLDGEDYRRHQGVRHPRTAVAMTGGGKLLMMTVDGRRNETAGMTAKELTQFFKKYFNPRSALNIDGGGSTTMWIKDKGNPKNGVVNYPTDNNKYDNFGQRRVRTFIIIKKVSTDADFADGTGTQYDPYVIKTAKHLANMHNVDWTDADKNPLYFKLEADIDMSGRMWEPINFASPYARHLHFDGNGFVIKNLTSKGFTYSSLFGVLCGSCKNLGIINADIDTRGGGGGIIAGYVGLKGPNAPTGTVDNCYTSGVVKGTDIIGGIAGNIGKENGSNYSAVRNSYSTATVIATASPAQARAGGIVGIVWAKGIIENCYSTGEIISETFGAGGIAGWTDSDVISCVALNKSITNKGSGRIGRIGGNMGQVGSAIAQGVNCWGLENMEIWNLGQRIPESALVTGMLTASGPYDGESKSKTFLQTPSNYSGTLGWNLTGATQIWSSSFNSKGYPILKWLEDRGGDYEALDGHD